jgi:Spy/CpxP family protein refolding chaperone
MKLYRTIMALGLAAASIGAATAATAQPYHGHGRHHQVCHMERHHHHRVRVCR